MLDQLLVLNRHHPPINHHTTMDHDERGDELAAAFNALLEAGHSLKEIPRMRAVLEKLLVEKRAAARHAATDGGLHPDRLYTTKGAARFLGVSPGTANNIPHAVVPHRGGKWLGVDLMAHRGELSWEEAAAYKRARREAVLRVAEGAVLRVAEGAVLRVAEGAGSEGDQQG